MQCKFGAAVLVFCLGVKTNFGKNSMKLEKIAGTKDCSGTYFETRSGIRRYL